MAVSDQTQTALAVLSEFDGTNPFTFLIQPETIRYNPRAVYSSLPVLNTAQPLVKYKYSESAIVIPNAKLWTDTGLVSIKPQLDQLIAWTRPDPSQGIPKLLKFRWGTEVIERCYLSSFAHTVTARFANTEPTMATGDLELLIAPEVPEPKKEDRSGKLTDREVEVNQRKLDSRLERTPGLRQELGLRDGENLTVNEDGKIVVTRDGKEIPLGDLEALLGDDLSRTLKRIPEG